MTMEEYEPAFAGGDGDDADRPFSPVDGAEGAATAPPAGPLPLVLASDFADRPKPERHFLDAAGLIPMRNVTLISGDGGTGKSLLAMQLACGVSVSGRWLGLNMRRGTSLYLSAEDDEIETHLRLREISEADGFDLASATDLNIALLAGQDAVLAAENVKTGRLSWTAVHQRLKATLEATRPVLLILDNLADMFAGNENVRSSARQFIGILRGIAMEYDCAVVLLSHPSLSGISNGTGTSGNTAWSNSVRSRLYLRRDFAEDGRTELNPNRRVLETKKANYGPVGGSILVEWQDGRFTSQEALTRASGALDMAARQSRADRVFMELLRMMTEQDRPVSPARSPTYAPTLFAHHPSSEGVTAREFEAAMERLAEKGEIVFETSGPASRRRQRIVEKELSK